MKFIIATNPFKGSLTSPQAARAIAKAFRETFPDAEIDSAPIADGGDGTLDCIAASVPFKRIRKTVPGPFGAPIAAEYLLIDGGETAVIEMARASGLALIKPKDRDPLIASSAGTGSLIRDALDRGCRKLIIGIGGSATNDGGLGAAVCAGYKFLDSRGRELIPFGASLGLIKSIDSSLIHPALKQTEIIAACDVTNPLLGKTGATRVYSPQKGASPAVVRRLETGMKNFADVTEKHFGADMRNHPGAGAAGGMGFGLMVFFGAKLVSGIDMMIAATKLGEQIRGADLLITGEGRMDSQSIQGKAPFGLLKLAKQHGVPVIAFCGSIQDEKLLYKAGFDSVTPILNEPMTLEQAMAESENLLYHAALRAARLLKLDLRGKR